MSECLLESPPKNLCQQAPKRDYAKRLNGCEAFEESALSSTLTEHREAKRRNWVMFIEWKFHFSTTGRENNGEQTTTTRQAFPQREKVLTKLL